MHNLFFTFISGYSKSYGVVRVRYIVRCESESRPIKRLAICDIFTQAKCISVKFCQFVASLYLASSFDLPLSGPSFESPLGLL